MPHTLHALDTLLARLLRTETLIAGIVIGMQVLNGFGNDTEVIGGSIIAVAVALGRSIVKASGYRDMPNRLAPPEQAEHLTGADEPAD